MTFYINLPIYFPGFSRPFDLVLLLFCFFLPYIFLSCLFTVAFFCMLTVFVFCLYLLADFTVGTCGVKLAL